MTIEEKIYSILAATSAFTALVPASRIKTPGNWQNIALPYVIHFPVSSDPTHMYSGLARLNHWDFYQISVFGSSYSSARAVVDVLRDTLGDKTIDGVRFNWRGPHTPIHESDTNLIHIPVDFEIFEAL